MPKSLARCILIGIVACVVSACGSTPAPAVTAPTQTPWIVVVTATPESDSVSQVQPTQTPWIIVVTVAQAEQPTVAPTQAEQATATPTQGKQATPMGTASATTRPATTPQGQGPTAKPPQTGATSTPTKAVTPTKPPTPTRTSSPAVSKYPAPVLVEPPTSTVVPWRGTRVLAWNPVGELAEDEYYCVQFDRTPKTAGEVPWGDWDCVKDPSYVLEGAFKRAFHLPEAQGQATVYWWVRVVRKTGEDQNGKTVGEDVSPLSEKWILLLEAKPADA